MNKALYFLSFAVGAVTGGLISWRVTKKKMGAIVDEELASIRKAYSREEGIKKLKEKVPDKPDISEVVNQIKDQEVYQQKVRDMNYSNPLTEEQEKPYVIVPDDFGMFSDYDTDTLYFYDDGYLVDENDDELTKEDVEKYVGFDALNHFGEYEDDVVYVRNDIMKRDFEIILEHTNRKDIPKPDKIELEE